MKKVFKIITLGDQGTVILHLGVGKTSIVEAYINNRYSAHVQPTLGACFYKRDVIHRSQEYSLEVRPLYTQIWDTAGQERYRSLLKLYYRSCDAVIMVFDVASRKSFERIKDWTNELEQHCQFMPSIVLVGNKSDLIDDEQVSYEEAKAMAKSGWGFVYCSAKEQKNIDAIFEKVVELAILNDGRKEKERQKKLEKDLQLRKQPSKSKKRCC